MNFFYTTPTTPPPLTPWGEEVGKTHHIQSKKDMSLFIYKKRRHVVSDQGGKELHKIKETRTQTGSATGAYEIMQSNA